MKVTHYSKPVRSVRTVSIFNYALNRKLKAILCLCLTVSFAQAQTDSVSTISNLTDLSLEELMNIEVTSVTNRPVKLTEVASAIQVISGEDIQRSGVTRLPESLKLVSNLQVLQANSHSWAITARGFSGSPSSGGIIANKLLVMIDGRSIYTPLFGGVYWDVQNVMLRDVDRVEAVSGPGGTLWGANAVNGVINIVSKSAKETQGLYASVAAGSFLKDLAEVRYGGRSKVDSNLYFRMYAQRFDQNSATLSGLLSDTIKNAWNMTNGGFRMDYYITPKTSLTLQGDAYYGKENSETRYTITEGQNVLGRLTTNFSDKSNVTVQLYYDHAWRKTPNSLNPFFYNLRTYDSDIRHRFALGGRQSILYGAGFQLREDEAATSLKPLSRSMQLYTAFVQDEISIVPKKLMFTIGSKFLHNVFTGFEVQPSARLAWTPSENHTLWGAVSRVVRTPSRFDADLQTISKFKSEKVMSYEIGYRIRPAKQLSFSLASFYTHYDMLRSIDSVKPVTDPRITLALANSQVADSWGVELSFNYIATAWWRLRGGYTYFDKDIRAINQFVNPISEILESVESKHQVLLHSIMDLPRNFQLDIVGTYKDIIPRAARTPGVPTVFTVDMRLAWTYKFLQFSVVGQNLVEYQHTETGLSRIPRSVYGKVTINL